MDLVKYLKKMHFDERGKLRVYLIKGSPENRIFENEGAIAQDVSLEDTYYIKTEDNSKIGWILLKIG
jgi:hypothetical protein